MNAADLMTSFVVTVRPDATLEYAAQLMLQYRISGLPVTESDGTVLGIVTESDLLRRAEAGTEKHHTRWVSFVIGPGRLAQEYVHSHGRKVGDVMTERVFNVTPETSLADLVALMETKHVKRVPVVDQGRLVGIVSRADVMAALVGLLSEKPAGAVKDADIRSQILAEIDPTALGTSRRRRRNCRQRHRRPQRRYNRRARARSLARSCRECSWRGGRPRSPGLG